MGLRPTAEKPAPLLRLVYILGWLPAIVAAVIARPAGGPSFVISGAGAAGLHAGLGLGLSLAVISAGYLAAIRRPPPQRTLLVACIGSLLVALAIPVLFSADVYAYAYYGDLALHGRTPYGHDPAPNDPLAAAAVAAWAGHIPPRCVYGPVAVGIAALADVAGAPGGVAGQIVAQRLAAAIAYGACICLGLRLVREPRARAVLLLNPVVVWSVAEGHNDAAMLALVFAGLATTRYRPLGFAFAALVKAPALLLFGTLARNRSTSAALALVAAGYLPLLAALGAAARDVPGATAASDWQSPLGVLSVLVGRIPAVVLALVTLGAAAIAVRRLAPADRAAAFALATWFALPNAYPWYALWIVPLAAHQLDSIWSRALIVAALFAPVRAVMDATFPASNTFDVTNSLHGWMIALEFLPPLCCLAFCALWRRRAVVTALVVLALALCRAPAGAQIITPSPVPALSPSPAAGAPTAPPPAPQPQPAPVAAPTSGGPAATPTPGPASTPPAAPAPSAAPSGVPSGLPSGTPTVAPATGPSTAGTPSPVVSGTPSSLPSVSPTIAPTAGPSTTVTPAATATPAPATATPAPESPPATPTPMNPFGYVITPTAVPVTVPDGPHILEVLLNDRRIHAGGPLIVRVLTSANVVGVEARTLGRFIAIPQTSPGQFSLAYTMPGGIPFWLLNKNYDVVIAAATADGRQTTVSIPMLLTR